MIIYRTKTVREVAADFRVPRMSNQGSTTSTKETRPHPQTARDITMQDGAIALPQVAALEPALDPQQLVRIEAVHRGFFYQHLYSVALLLGVGRREGAVVAIERDEDIELRLADTTHYIQVKSRLGALQHNHLAETLQRFSELRAAHGSGQRRGRAVFTIVANSDPGPGLATQIERGDWPADVSLVTPSRSPRDDLPSAAPTIDEGVARCRELAAQIPFGGLSPETLVLKLAALVQHAAAGARDHLFAAQDLAGLFEQLVIQLQDFPEPPTPYRPLQNQPSLVSDQHVRLIIGFSGAGKTAWAAEAARHFAAPIVYFDVGGLPAAAVPTNLARELVARFMGGQARGVGGVQLPPEGGLDALRASDRALAQQGLSITVVLDNIHRLAPEDLRLVTEAAPSMSFIGLGQPWQGLAIAEATLRVTAATLEGFDADAVAAVFHAEGVGLEAETAREVIRCTGGLPLFVVNAARLTAQRFAGSSQQFCRAILDRTHDQETAQDLILETAFEVLSARARDAAALLASCDVPLLNDEVSALLTPLGPPPILAGAIRELRRASMLVSFPRAATGLHDALRPLAHGHLATMDGPTVDAALLALSVVLTASLRRERNIPRLTFLLRLLPRLGRTDVIVDLATTEMFHEQGNMSMMRDTLTAAAADQAATPLDRFWALDALAYWDSRGGGTPDPQTVARMEALVAQGGFEPREQLNLLFKQMTLASAAGERLQIERLMAEGRRIARNLPGASRLLRYNRAVSLFRVGAYQAVRSALEPLIDEYFETLGFDEARLIGANGRNLTALLANADEEDTKRLADGLNLWASTVIKLGHPPLLRRIQAVKLFAASGAGRSAAVAAQDGADEMLDFADAVGARQMMEQHVFPLVEQYHLTDLTLHARGQYAVILAYCGDFPAAEREIEALRNYGGDPVRMAELENQANLTELIRARVVTLQRRAPPPGGRRLIFNPNEVGRPQGDEPCPCRSGRKYKRCHGKK